MRSLSIFGPLYGRLGFGVFTDENEVDSYFDYSEDENDTFRRMEVQISNLLHDFEEHLEFEYSEGNRFGTFLPKEMANADEFELTITENGKTETVVLKREK